MSWVRQWVTGAGRPSNNSTSVPSRSKSYGAGKFWLLQNHCQTAIYLAEVDVPPRCPQLGLGDCSPDVDHQPTADATAHHADEVGAEDAEDRAAAEGDPGQVREIQHARPTQGGDEPGGRRALQARGRKSRGWLPAAP